MDGSNVVCLLDFIQYGTVTAPEKPETPGSGETPKYDFGTRLLRYRKGYTMPKGDDVLAVQARLTELGFDPGKADGVYGPKSSAGVTAFQAARKIEADGIVGPVTRAKLKKE